MIDIRHLYPRSGLRVVFDSNAFGEGAFELLHESPMRSLCRRGRIIPIYGHIFQEETLRAYGNARKRDALLGRWLPFIFNTTSQLCREHTDIWHEELVQGRRRKARIFLSGTNTRKFIARLKALPPDGSWPNLREALGAWAREAEKVRRMKERLVSLRKDVGSMHQLARYDSRRHGPISFARFVTSEVEYAGRAMLDQTIDSHYSLAVANRWALSMKDYPFFTEFVVGVLYMVFHAIARDREPMDLNAQADLELMAHLLHGDVLVSNETGFLRQAFLDLWQPRGRVMFTSAAFADLLWKM